MFIPPELIFQQHAHTHACTQLARAPRCSSLSLCVSTANKKATKNRSSCFGLLTLPSQSAASVCLNIFSRRLRNVDHKIYALTSCCHYHSRRLQPQDTFASAHAKTLVYFFLCCLHPLPSTLLVGEAADEKANYSTRQVNVPHCWTGFVRNSSSGFLSPAIYRSIGKQTRCTGEKGCIRTPFEDSLYFPLPIMDHASWLGMRHVSTINPRTQLLKRPLCARASSDSASPVFA